MKIQFGITSEQNEREKKHEIAILDELRAGLR